MDASIFRVTTVATSLGILDSVFRFRLLAHLDFTFCLPYACFHALLPALPLHALFACLPLHALLLALSLHTLFACLSLFTLFHALYMPKYLFGAIIHAF